MELRGNFTSRIGFILAAAGSAVGLGNIWRFPYLAGQNGGAAFLLIYLIFIFLLCFPVLVGEIAIGRSAGRDAYGSYSLLGGKRWGYLGIFGILAGIFILSFYNVVAGWAFGYFLEISFGNLLGEPDFGKFFGNYVNDISDNLWFSLGFMVITALIVSRGIQKGVEAANKIMMPALYTILILLILYSLTLPNAWAGVRFYLVPELNEINSQTIYDGLKQAFFSLSLGMGCLITYGSYVGKTQNIIKSAAIISVADAMVAFLAGFMIFPMVFSQNISPTEGPALVFIVLPDVFRDMGPLLGRIIGGSFFLLLCFAALTSTISLLEVPTTYVVDQLKFRRTRVVWFLALLIFILGLPTMFSQGMIPALNKLPFYLNRDWLSFVSDMCDISLTVGGCLMCIFIVRQWKIHNMDAELVNGNPGYMNSFMRKYLHVMITWVCPVLLGGLSVLIIDRYFGLGVFF
ncbi:MAG: sodium-dependent transporter [Cyclobacteriaceae bacterium]|nr:sodium-dependent transporter [Cyclobacteriaceae bacterium]